jgi:formylglycine-generating enzyme
VRKRTTLQWLSIASLCLAASAASAVTIDWTFVGNPGNACDTQSQGCFGSVGYGYSIGTYEITNAQYAEFLNAKAASDPLGLYQSGMGFTIDHGGITRSGSPGSYTYSTIAGRANMPVNWVSFYDALRFANWMSNGQGSGDTETGAYILLGGTATPSNGATVTRNAGSGANTFLASEDEWYKAAYYDPTTSSYFDFPMSTNGFGVCSGPTATPGRANCAEFVGDVTNRGSYTGSASPYGTFDQGGNVSEWTEAIISTNRGWRGGDFHGGESLLNASSRFGVNPTGSSDATGFRLVVIPEPDTAVLLSMGVLGLACRRRIGRRRGRS